MIKFVHDDLGELSFRTPTWADFAAWWDSINRGMLGDASNNLCVACVAKPGAAELSEVLEEYGFLATAITEHLLDHVGAPEAGFGTRYEEVPSEQVSADMLNAVKGRAKRPLFFQLPCGVWAFKRPSSMAASLYADGVASYMAKKDNASFAYTSRALVLSCLLSPTSEEAVARIDECPYIVFKLADQLREAGGGKGLARA